MVASADISFYSRSPFCFVRAIIDAYRLRTSGVNIGGYADDYSRIWVRKIDHTGWVNRACAWNRPSGGAFLVPPRTVGWVNKLASFEPLGTGA